MIMMKNKKFLKIFVAVIMLISVCSICVFAANPVNVYDYDMIPGYRCNYFLRYDKSSNAAYAQTLVTWNGANTDTETFGNVLTQCVVTYTDGTTDVSTKVSSDIEMNKLGGPMSMVTVNINTNKTIEKINSVHFMYVNGDFMGSYRGELVSGIDF